MDTSDPGSDWDELVVEVGCPREPSRLRPVGFSRRLRTVTGESSELEKWGRLQHHLSTLSECSRTR